MTGCIPLRKGEICMNFPTIDRSFFAGECFDAYRVLGAHPCRDDFGQEGWRFAVWAPGAVA